MDKKFWTVNKFGNEEIRDLAEENKTFTWHSYSMGNFDSYNYQYYENFHHYIHDDIGCDYERYGCVIQEGDVVLDIGANIGVFAHRAETRGASKVICFEPMTPTYKCLIKNAGPKTLTYKNAVGGSFGNEKFFIHTDFTNTGGSTNTDQDHLSHDKDILYTENVFKIDINEIFESFEKIDFLKIDIEGGEVEVLTNIKDEHLKSLRCLAAEFHNTYPEFKSFQNDFWNRMLGLGFNGFILYHGSDEGILRTLNFWKV
jgi:FkbM family methyltransferase